MNIRCPIEGGKTNIVVISLKWTCRITPGLSAHALIQLNSLGSHSLHDNCFCLILLIIPFAVSFLVDPLP